MPKWYDAAPPDVEEVAKKEFGTLIEDDPEWKVLGTIADEDVIKSWVQEVPTKLAQSGTKKSIQWSMSDIAALKEAHWHSKYWGVDLPDDPLDVSSWLGTIPLKPWVTYYQSTPEGLKPYSNGGLVLGPPELRTPLPHQCHCLRDRHLEPLRQRVADMLSTHTFDANWDASEDLSPMVCVGSETYGPNRPNAARTVNYGGGYEITAGDVSTEWNPDHQQKQYELMKKLTAWTNPYLPYLSEEIEITPEK